MTGKSVWAVAAGVLFIVIVTTLVDIVLHTVGAYPPWDQPLDDKLAKQGMKSVTVTVATSACTGSSWPCS